MSRDSTDSPHHDWQFMKVRRVITGLNSEGLSCVVADGSPPNVERYEAVPGLETHFLWSTRGVPALPSQSGDPTLTLDSYFPAAGDARFIVVTHPPGSGVTVGRSLRELRDPGNRTETDTDGVMHETATIDFGVILSGAISMALDDGTEVALSAGDVIVQTGVRHGWLNYGSEPCVMAFVILGASRRQNEPFDE